MKKVTQDSLHIFDNKGETLDRYTVVFPNGDIYGCSKNPMSPTGVGTFSHNTDSTVKEYVWEGKKEFVNEAQATPQWIGKEISLDEAPEKVKEFIKKKNESIQI